MASSSSSAAARVLLAAAICLACLTSGARAQYQQQPMMGGFQQAPQFQQQQPMGVQQPMGLQQMQQQQAQQQQMMQQQQPQMTAAVIDFPAPIKALMMTHSVPNEAYTWTEEQCREHVNAENTRICAPVKARCPRGAVKCKCRIARPLAPFLTTVTQMQEYAERMQAQTSFAQEQQVEGQLQAEQQQEQVLQSAVSSQKSSTEGYQLLSAALAVCLVISVGFNYVNTKGGVGPAAGVGGRDSNMRSEVKAAIASMTRA